MKRYEAFFVYPALLSMYQFQLLVVVICSFLTVIAAVNFSESHSLLNVCYDEYGCFTSGPPFGLTLQRPIALLPDSPDVVSTQFLLYTRESPANAQLIDRHTTLGLWNKTKATKILIHGFLDTVHSTWWMEMKDALLKVEDCNVILVDWSRANYFPYTKATANSQIVGVDIALLVNTMIEKHGANADDFHLVAHSLGCAVAGYAGHRIQQLGRITGLDPAGPFFESTDPIVRLDASDAKFVDVIHTDGTSTLLLGFGTLEQVGHIDFYPNGGIDQPSCEKTTGKLIDAILNLGPLDIVGPMDIQGFFNTTLCSHFAAVHLFINSILDRCVYRGFSCDSNEEFQAEKCSLIGNEGNFLGYHASPKKTLGRLYLNTQRADKAPFCIHHYQISLESGSAFIQTKGEIDLILSSNFTTQSVPFDSKEMWLTRNTIETRYFPMKSDLGDIQGVDIQFQRINHWSSSILYSNQWEFTRIILVDGDREKRMIFCPDKDTSIIQSGDVLSFSSC